MPREFLFLYLFVVGVFGVGPPPFTGLEGLLGDRQGLAFEEGDPHWEALARMLLSKIPKGELFDIFAVGWRSGRGAAFCRRLRRASKTISVLRSELLIIAFAIAFLLCEAVLLNMWGSIKELWACLRNCRRTFKIKLLFFYKNPPTCSTGKTRLLFLGSFSRACECE